MIHCPELVAGLPYALTAGGDPRRHLAAMCLPDGRGSWKATGRDVTEHYQLVAWLALSAAWEAGCQAALLTDGSPACGSQFVYDGSFRGRRKAGAGVAADLLRAHGITVFSDGQIPQLLGLDGTEGAG
ncbi:DUF523 domain-containing protein [Klebsiella pneumoniae]|nr:DUF523 domain-containing protein [Klebsiella pneumoniae]